MALTRFDGTLDQYPEEYLRCRGRKSHPWGLKPDFRTTFNARGRLIEFIEILSCSSCSSQKRTKYKVLRNGSFDRIGKPYIDYQPGYQVRREHPLAGRSTNYARDAMLSKQLMRDLEERGGEGPRAILRAIGG